MCVSVLWEGKPTARRTCERLVIQMANDEKGKFLTVAEVADIMRVSKMTVYRLVHSGELPAVRVGRSFRVNESAVSEYLESSVYDVGTDAS